MKECYIDMHCHILPGVDDGAKDLAETKKNFRNIAGMTACYLTEK